MGPVHAVLNRVDTWSESDSFIKRNVATRLANITVAVPAELSAVAQNALLTPVQAAGIILGLGARIVSFISGSTAVKNFQESMPGVTDFLRTVARIVAFSIGTALTATVGVISPTANFKAHCALGLAYSEKEEAVQQAEAERAAQEARIASRNNQIAEDLKEVEELPHEVESDSTMVYGKVATEETTAEVPADLNTVVVDETVTLKGEVEEENPYAGLEELFNEVEAKILAEQEKAAKAEKTLLSRVSSLASDVKNAVVNKYSLAGIASAAAAGLVYYTQFMTEAADAGTSGAASV